MNRCIERQDGLCAVCGYNLEGNAHLHEATVKRGDLPKDRHREIFVPINCVALHPHCHKNTKEVDDACHAYLLWCYGVDAQREWILSLGFKELPVRAKRFFRVDNT